MIPDAKKCPPLTLDCRKFYPKRTSLKNPRGFRHFLVKNVNFIWACQNWCENKSKLPAKIKAACESWGVNAAWENLYLFRANISKIVGPASKSHFIAMRRHDSRSPHKPEMTSRMLPPCVETLICLFGGNISRRVGTRATYAITTSTWAFGLRTKALYTFFCYLWVWGQRKMNGMDSEVCAHHKFGFCKYQQSCTELHFTETCSERCLDIKECKKWHDTQEEVSSIGQWILFSKGVYVFVWEV